MKCAVKTGKFFGLRDGPSFPGRRLVPGNDDVNASSQSLQSACEGSDVPEHSNTRASSPCCKVKVICCNAPPPGSWSTAEHALGIRLDTFQTPQDALAPMLQEKELYDKASSVDVEPWPNRRPSGPLRSHGASDLPCGHQGITSHLRSYHCHASWCNMRHLMALSGRRRPGPQVRIK